MVANPSEPKTCLSIIKLSGQQHFQNCTILLIAIDSCTLYLIEINLPRRNQNLFEYPLRIQIEKGSYEIILFCTV